MVGRNPNATIFVEDHTIAKDHAIIEMDENMANPFLVDRGSVSGCTVNGHKVAKGGKQKLYSNDSIKFGSYPIEYKLIVDMLDGFRLPNPDKFEDDKTSVSAFGDKRIQLVDEKN